MRKRQNALEKPRIFVVPLPGVVVNLGVQLPPQTVGEEAQPACHDLDRVEDGDGSVVGDVELVPLQHPGRVGLEGGLQRIDGVQRNLTKRGTSAGMVEHVTGLLLAVDILEGHGVECLAL